MKPAENQRFTLLKRLKPHRWFLIALLAWNVILGANIARTGQWSAWINGDAQSMLTLRYWVRDGYVTPHAFLFITQGYTPHLSIFDGTDLDDHALSSAYSVGDRLVKRVYYNHYPTFYLLPQAILSIVVGSEHRLLFQLTSLLLSTLSLVFLYAFLLKLFKSKLASALATMSFAISELYVDWAHSLANMPIDDFFRNGFLLLTVLEKTATMNRKRFTIAAWITYFLLTLVSLESIVFGFIWLVGYDLLNEKKLKLKRWFIFGMAAILARVIQLGQSIIALGWNDTVLDWTGRWSTIANEDGETNPFVRFLSISRELRYLIGFGWDKHRIIELHAMTFFVTSFLILGLGYLWWRSKKDKKALIPLLLLAAGCAFGFIFPGASWMRYEGRQFIPFFTATIVYVFASWPTLTTKKDKIIVTLLLILPISFIVVRQTYLGINSVLTNPIYSFGKPEPSLVAFGESLAPHVDNQTTMVFLYDPEGKLTLFYPHPQDPRRSTYSMSPQLLYAADAHVMGFKDKEILFQDLEKILERTNVPITPYFVAETKDIESLRTELSSHGFTFDQTDTLTDSWVGMKPTPLFRPRM
ncbi:MAG: hypothetical protein WC787_03045 [Patescibacteria group bacterium]|jgi:hypothetical protein